MALCVFTCAGGTLTLPAADLVLVDREDGGNLVVNPPRQVWERGELTADELRNWTFLIAAAGSAMLGCLPQLASGCVNYWEAGNWALNEEAPPAGLKPAPAYRSVHLHLLGRSMHARSPHWRWGEAPIFPRYADRKSWASSHRRLTPPEVQSIVRATAQILKLKYELNAGVAELFSICEGCSYPQASRVRPIARLCSECAPDA